MSGAGAIESHRERELIAFKVGGQEYCVSIRLGANYEGQLSITGVASTTNRLHLRHRRMKTVRIFTIVSAASFTLTVVASAADLDLMRGDLFAHRRKRHLQVSERV